MCNICKIIGKDWHDRDINVDELNQLDDAFQKIAQVLQEANREIDLQYDHAIGPFFVSIDCMNPEGEDLPYILLGNDSGSKLQVDLRGNTVQVYWSKEQTSRTDICIARIKYDETNGFVTTETFTQDFLSEKYTPIQRFLMKYFNESWMDAFLENGLSLESWIDDVEGNEQNAEDLGFNDLKQMKELNNELLSG